MAGNQQDGLAEERRETTREVIDEDLKHVIFDVLRNAHTNIQSAKQGPAEFKIQESDAGVRKTATVELPKVRRREELIQDSDGGVDFGYETIDPMKDYFTLSISLITPEGGGLQPEYYTLRGRSSGDRVDHFLMYANASNDFLSVEEDDPQELTFELIDSLDAAGLM